MTYLLLALIALLALERYLGQRDFLDLLEAERRKGREERDRLLDYLKLRDASHDERERSFRLELAQMHQARMEETANLLQRIQAPEQAVVEHTAATAQPDPPPVNLESDDALYEVYQQRVRDLGVLNG